jgi:hypothetical protein
MSYPADHAAELDDRPVPGALNDPTVMDGDDRVDQVAAERPETSEDPILVGGRESAVADDVGDKNRRELALLPLFRRHVRFSRRSLPYPITVPANPEHGGSVRPIAANGGMGPRTTTKDAKTFVFLASFVVNRQSAADISFSKGEIHAILQKVIKARACFV